MPKSDGQLRWNVERRLEFIEFRLFWDGRINRADLVRFFGISVPQASADLARYQNAAPGNVLYDKTAKTYVASDEFTPVFLTPSSDRYLTQLRLLGTGILTDEQTWLRNLPTFSILPVLQRHIDEGVLRSVLEAIRRKLALRVRYQSFSSPKPTSRWITPHALGFDGRRWHARAWCHINSDFRDFVLARILSVAQSRIDDREARSDIAWWREVTLRLAPHPKMQEGMRRAIELDYGMVQGTVEIRTRVCLSYYLERQLCLDLDPSKVPASRQQLVLVNREEVEAVRSEVQAELRQTALPEFS